MGQVGLKIDATLIAFNKTCDGWCNFVADSWPSPCKENNIHAPSRVPKYDTHDRDWESKGVKRVKIKMCWKEKSVLSTHLAMVSISKSALSVDWRSLVENHNGCCLTGSYCPCLVQLPRNRTNKETTTERLHRPLLRKQHLWLWLHRQRQTWEHPV